MAVEKSVAIKGTNIVIQTVHLEGGVIAVNVVEVGDGYSHGEAYSPQVALDIALALMHMAAEAFVDASAERIDAAVREER